MYVSECVCVFMCVDMHKCKNTCIRPCKCSHKSSSILYIKCAISERCKTYNRNVNFILICAFMTMFYWIASFLKKLNSCIQVSMTALAPIWRQVLIHAWLHVWKPIQHSVVSQQFVPFSGFSRNAFCFHTSYLVCTKFVRILVLI